MRFLLQRPLLKAILNRHLQNYLVIHFYYFLGRICATG